jgi:iron(III) transport system permease protein
VRRAGRPPGAAWSSLALTAVLAWLVAYPLLVVFAEAAGADLGAFARQASEWRALWASLWTSAASVALAAAVGVPLAFVFERYDFPGRKVLGAMVALPAVMPPLVGVIAFFFLYGETGFAARAVQALLRLDSAPWRLQGPGAILLIHAYSMYVYFYLFVRAALARLDASVLEAAASLGASGWQTFLRVTLPLLRPALAGAALLTFMTALGSFSAPLLYGGGFRVMTTQIRNTSVNGDMPTALLETALLTAVALIGFAVIQWREGSAAVASVGKGAPPALRAITVPWARRAASLAGWLLAALLLLPHATLLLISFVPVGTWSTETLPPVLSLENYRRMFSEAERLRSLANSAWMATVATGGALALALWAGPLVVRHRVRAARAIEALLALPWAVPGTVLAIALATTFSVASPATGRVVLVGTVAILPLAYLVRNLPLTGRAVLAGYRQLDPALDEAAQSLGAGRWRRMLRVTMPLLKPALAAGGSLAFVTALGDFVVSIILETYANRPISAQIFSSLRVNELGVAAAFGVVLMAVSAAALGAGARVGTTR